MYVVVKSSRSLSHLLMSSGYIKDISYELRSIVI